MPALSIAAKMQTAIRGLLVTGSSKYSRNYQGFSETFDQPLQDAVANAAGDPDLVTPLGAIGDAVNEWRSGPVTKQLKLDASPRHGERSPRHRSDRRRRNLD